MYRALPYILTLISYYHIVFDNVTFKKNDKSTRMSGWWVPYAPPTVSASVPHSGPDAHCYKSWYRPTISHSGMCNIACVQMSKRREQRKAETKTTISFL